MKEIQTLEVGKLHESPTNPRKTFDKVGLEELERSIEDNGILTPLLVRSNSKGYEVIAGARRLRAAKAAKLTEVPCIISVLTDEEAQAIQIIENLQRADVHPLEEAIGFEGLRKEHGYSIEQLAARFAKTPAYVAQKLKLVNLTEPIRKLFFAGEINVSHAFLAARLTPEQQKEALKWLKRGDSVRGFSEEIQRYFYLELKSAPFNVLDAKLVPAAGSCQDCPKRTGANALLFTDIKQADICTDGNCFDTKVAAFVKVQIAAHPKAIRLAIGSEYDQGRSKSKATTQWVKAGNLKCNNLKEGIIVEQIAHRANERQSAKLGTVLEVCVDPKCKVHKADSYSYSSGNKRGPLTLGEKKRRALFKQSWSIDQAIHVEMVASLRLNPKKATTEDLRRTVMEMLSTYSFKYRCQFLAPAFGLKTEGKSPSQHGQDGQEKLGKLLAKADGKDLMAFLLASSLTPSGPNDDELRKDFRAAAKRFGVDIAAIEKAVTTKPAKKAKAKTKAA